MSESTDGVRVWLVERTFSDDEQNIVVLVYATPDGERYLRKERALTSFTGPARTTTAAVAVDPGNLDGTPDGRVEQYRREAQRMSEAHDPGDAV